METFKLCYRVPLLNILMHLSILCSIYLTLSASPSLLQNIHMQHVPRCKHLQLLQWSRLFMTMPVEAWQAVA